MVHTVQCLTLKQVHVINKGYPRLPPSMQDLLPTDKINPPNQLSNSKSSNKETPMNIRKKKGYLGPNPAIDPLGQSYNEFYKLEVGRIRKANFAKLNLDDEIMAAAIKWIQENLSKGTFQVEENEDEGEAMTRHLDCWLILI